MLARGLIVVLGVLNLVVAVWWWRQPPPSAPVLPPWPDAPRLQTVATVGPAAATRDSPPAGPALPAEGICLRIGPFADAVGATALRMRLPPGATPLAQAASAGGGHWLHLRWQAAWDARVLDELVGGAGVAWQREPCPPATAPG